MFEQSTFENLFAIPQRNGLTKPERIRGEGVKMVNMGELFARRRISNLQMDRVPCTSRELSLNKLEQGDLLFARQSLTLEGAGKCSIFLGDQEDVVFESHLIRCRLDKSKFDPLYYFYFFESKFGKKRISSIVEQVAAAGIRGSDLVTLPVFTPPLPTQKAISQILGNLDDKIELNQKMNQTLEDIAKAIFKSWFIDFDPVREKVEGRLTGLPDEISALFPSEFVESEFGEIPQGWEIKKVSDFGKVICGKTPSTKVVGNFNGEFPFITIPDMRSGITSLKTERTLTQLGANELTGKMLPEGSICVSCIATPGLVTITSTNSFTNQQINSIIPNNKNHREFLFFSMLGLESVIKSIGSGGSVFTNLNTSQFKLLPITKPSENLINKFSEISNPILEKIIINQRQSSILMTIRDSLLPKLISGELQIPDAEKFLEEVDI